MSGLGTAAAVAMMKNLLRTMLCCLFSRYCSRVLHSARWSEDSNFRMRVVRMASSRVMAVLGEATRETAAGTATEASI
jgi:hypothetical protein